MSLLEQVVERPLLRMLNINESLTSRVERKAFKEQPLRSVRGINSISFEETLHLLLHCPREPIFLPKGQKNIYFKLPEDFIKNNYKEFADAINNQVSKFSHGPTIIVKSVKTLPDLKLFSQIGPDDNFSFFLEKHREIASQLVQLFLGAKDQDELIVSR